jgi:transcription termination factor Rho
MEKLIVKKTTKKVSTKTVSPVTQDVSETIAEEIQLPVVQTITSEIVNQPEAVVALVENPVVSEKTIMPTVTIKPTVTIRPTMGIQSTNGVKPMLNTFKKPQNFEKDVIAKSMTLKELDEKSIMEMRKIAQSLEVKDIENYSKNDLIIKILEEQTKRGGNIFAEGVLEVINDGSHGVLRSLKMLPGNNDVYVSGSQIKRFNLKQGDYISGQARAPKEGERYLSMLRIEAINNLSPDDALKRPMFTKLTPIFPNKQIKLETEPHILSTRLIDLLAPIGKGQRGMLVSPPKVGKTWLLKEIAEGISKNYPEIHLMVVLVGERPEEVTDMERSVKGEVIAANFDEPPELHTKIAEMAIERAKRLVELGKDVVILMDSLTRLARAYNITAPPSGRTLSGGFDPVAIYPPKKFFGAARNFEERGSLTIIATALVETGSRMDEVIFEEFKGTGNMELKLDRRLAERRVYPAIDVKSSGTRNEDKLLSPEVLNSSWRVRRMLDIFKDDEATMMMIDRLKKTKTNKEFLATLHEDMR